jgi:hypothetical protein
MQERNKATNTLRGEIKRVSNSETDWPDTTELARLQKDNEIATHKANIEALRGSLSKQIKQTVSVLQTTQ